VTRGALWRDGRNSRESGVMAMPICRSKCLPRHNKIMLIFSMSSSLSHAEIRAYRSENNACLKISDIKSA
jgi:hypothetical protein